MLLSELLRSDCVLLEVEGLDKWQLIERLAGLLVEAGRLPEEHRDTVLESLLIRERSMSTGMENGVAIPHCSREEVDETLVCLGISPAGVDFEAIDEKLSHLVLLLVTPKNRTKVHIRTLAEIAKLLNKAEFRSQLVGARTAEEVLELVRKRETAV